MHQFSIEELKTLHTIQIIKYNKNYIIMLLSNDLREMHHERLLV